MASKRLPEDFSCISQSSKRVCLDKMKSSCSNDLDLVNCNGFENLKEHQNNQSSEQSLFGIQPSSESLFQREEQSLFGVQPSSESLFQREEQSLFGVQPSSESLFQREEKLRKIHYYLFEDTKKILVLNGMSGVGKTEITKKYCTVYRNFYKNIIWIDAAMGKLESSMKSLCQSLGFSVQDSKGDYLDIEVIIELIHNYYKNEKTLYILDNVDDKSVRNIRLYISRKSGSFTLITSQWRSWSDNVDQMIIDVFSPEEAFNYIKTNIKINNEEKTKELVKEFGFHPFAITQAIKYMNKHEVSIETFINRYRLHPIEILDNKKFRTEEESNSTIKVINLVLVKLEKTAIIPLKILNFLSHCDGQNISKHFLIQISKYMKINEEYLIDDAILLLQNYSLLDRSDDGNYTMHELIQLSCKYYQKKNSSTNTYLNLIEKYFELEVKEVEIHINYENHCVIHFLRMFRTNIKRMSKVFHRSADKINRFLTCKGLYLEAVEILKCIQSFNTETYGEYNELTLDTKDSIANCLLEMGKYNEALEILFSVDKMKTEILGLKHPSAIKVKNTIGNCLYEMAKYNEALNVYYSVDKIQTEVFGINHTNTTKTKNYIAKCLYHMGKFKEALEIYNSVDTIKTETLGIKDQSTITTKTSIASCFYEMGNYNKALEIHYSVDKIQTENLGLKHPSTIDAKNSIAHCLYEMEKYNEALKMYYSVDIIQTEVFGINHPNTMDTKDSITKCLRKLEKR